MGHILVVEDDAASREMLSGLVQVKEHVVVCMRNGRSAWECLTDRPSLVDLVITDLMMSEMDGYELVDRIRNHSEMSGLPIIVQSAYLGVKKTKLLLEHGVDLVIPKPVDGGYLLEYIERYTTRPDAA